MKIPTTSTPLGNAAAVTPSDVTVFEPSTIYVGGTGDVQVLPADAGPNGTPVVYKAVPVGFVLPVLVSKVYSTNTTATLMVRQF